eukprot:637568-Pelagomonas_calceolata.AAC.6
MSSAHAWKPSANMAAQIKEGLAALAQQRADMEAQAKELQEEYAELERREASVEDREQQLADQQAVIKAQQVALLFTKRLIMLGWLGYEAKIKVGLQAEARAQQVVTNLLHLVSKENFDGSLLQLLLCSGSDARGRQRNALCLHNVAGDCIMLKFSGGMVGAMCAALLLGARVAFVCSNVGAALFWDAPIQGSIEVRAAKM